MRTIPCLTLLLCLVFALPAWPAPRRLVVAQDGTGDYGSITNALAACKNATEAAPVDILIKPGTYLETVTTLNWVNLIGEDRDACVISYTIPPELAPEVHKHHTIWATSNTTIKNLTIIGGIVKYVIHSDGGRPYVLTIENCVLRRTQKTAYPAAFGIGLRTDQHIIMKGCFIEATFPIFWHNSVNQKSPCSMTLEKCTLKGTDYALRMSLLGSKQQDAFVIHDSVLEGAQGAVLYVNQRGVQKAPHWNGQDEVTVYGSGNTMGAVTGTSMIDDTGQRVPGVERTRRAPHAPLAKTDARLDK
jgi:hypothetical protein